MHVTGDTRMKDDVLQLAAAILLWLPVPRKGISDSKSLKTIRMKPFSDNFTVETDVEAQIS